MRIYLDIAAIGRNQDSISWRIHLGELWKIPNVVD